MGEIIKRLKVYTKYNLKTLSQYPSWRNFLSTIIDFPIWWKHLNPKHNSMTDQMPWIAFSAIRFIKKHINKDSVIYEVGSGGSTLFWSNKAKEVISIEHDKDWYNNVEKKIKEQNRTNITYQWIGPQKDTNPNRKSISNPLDYISEDKNFDGMNFRDYAMNIDQYPDDYFDFILIDGRARPSCLHHAIDKVKNGGFLILDNSERTYYLENIDELRNCKKWKRTDFFAPFPYIYHFSRTSCFQKMYSPN